jgi:sulfofructose kinase
MLPVAPADRPFDVVGLGAASLDLVYVLPANPLESGAAAAGARAASLGKFRIQRHFVSPGGQVATALATCARLGLRARFAGVLGSNGHADVVRRALIERGVDVTDVIVHDGQNQYAIILIDEASGERTVLWDRDQRLILGPQEPRPEIAALARVVHVDDVDVEAAIRFADLVRGAGALTTCDIDQVTGRTMALISAVTIPIVAEHVPASLTGIDDTSVALRTLGRYHPGVLCVTLGIGGTLALDGDRLVHVPAFQVQAVDTTGAGDVFRGAFIYALLQGLALEEGLRFANAAAAVSCTRLGAMASVPSLDEVERMLRAGLRTVEAGRLET